MRVEPGYMGIPRGLYERHTFVTLMVDVMFVNRTESLATLSKEIRLFTCGDLPSCKAAQLSCPLKNELIYTK